MASLYPRVLDIDAIAHTLYGEYDTAVAVASMQVELATQSDKSVAGSGSR
jgi:hypothetical protein